MKTRHILRAYLVAFRRNKAVVGILFAGLLLFGGILATFHALWERNHSTAVAVREDALWAAYQTDREAVRLLEILREAAIRPEAVALSDIVLRFDILYSRHEVMEDSDFAAKFRDDPRIKTEATAIGDILHRMVPTFDRLAASTTASPGEIADMLTSGRDLQAATQRLLASTHQVQVALQVDDRAETALVYQKLAVAIGAMTLSLGVVIVLIWRQLHQLEATRFRLQRLSEELAQSAASAEAGNRAKSAFLATMSHEIRTPLNGIIGIAELLAQTPLDEGQREQLGVIHQCSDGLIAIINDILDFSKLESGVLDLERRPVDLGEIVDGVVDMLAPRAEAKGIDIVAGHPLAAYVTDPTRLRQVLVNLVGNAVKFTEHGVVAVRIFETRRREGELGLRVVVQDTGIGISAENQKRLFGEFTQADASINRRFGGTGLGLAISRRIVRALGGDIHVESRAGEGATFWFEIPVEKVASADLRPQAPGIEVRVETSMPIVDGVMGRSLALLGLDCHSAARGPRRRLVLTDVATMEEAELHGRVLGREVVVFGFGARRFADRVADVVEGPMTTRRLARLIAHRVAGTAYGTSVAKASEAASDLGGARGHVLVVEDNLVNQRVAVGLLERLGFSVEVVGDGLAAVERLGRDGIDLVLMDMQMPTMDGLEATRRVRAGDGPHRTVPIVGLTANAFASDREACLAAGMDDFVAKPVTRAKLAAVLDRFRPVVHADMPDEAVVAPAPGLGDLPAEIETGVLDVVHRDGLADALGAEGLAELDGIFRIDVAQLLEDLAGGREAGDETRMRRALHTLKGAAANVGAIRVVSAVDAVRAGLGGEDAEAFGRLGAAVLACDRALVVDGARRGEETMRRAEA